LNIDLIIEARCHEIDLEFTVLIDTYRYNLQVSFELLMHEEEQAWIILLEDYKVYMR